MNEKQHPAHSLQSRHQLGVSSLTVEAAHLDELRRLWSAGALTKRQFMEAMHIYHSLLFQYAQRLKDDNVIESFHLSAGRVEARTRDGVVLSCDPEDTHNIVFGAFNFGAAEHVLETWLRRLMPEKGVFFDIGANVGWHVLHIALLRPRGRVRAFEPLPPTHSRLQDNIVLNKLTNIETFNIGLGEKEEDMNFYFRLDMTGAASARNITEAEDALTYSCRVRRLDDCWREMALNPDLLKCDVEGAEIFVLRGGRECLEAAKPAVLCEMLRKWSAKFGYTPNDTLGLMSSLGYVCFEPLENDLRVFERMTDETLETNFLFLHREKHGKLIQEYSLPKPSVKTAAKRSTDQAL